MKQWLPWGIIAALVFGLVWQRHHDSALQERIHAREQHIAVLADSLGSLKAHADTLYETKWLPSKLRIDTLADTVKVPVEVVREVVRDADSTIRACRVTVAACELYADSLQAQIKDWKRVASGPTIKLLGYGAMDLNNHYYAGIEARVSILHLDAFGRVESRIDRVDPQYRIGVSLPF